MRNGGTAFWEIDYSMLKPDPAHDADPPSIDVKVRDPSGATAETAAYPGTIVRDSTGHFHWTSGALDYAKGGTYTFVAKAPGFPELRMELVVERSYWDG